MLQAAGRDSRFVFAVLTGVVGLYGLLAYFLLPLTWKHYEHQKGLAGLIMITRLWPLLILTLLACVLSIVAPQIPGIATGFVIMSALAWRNQYGAVLAVEGRDGVRFYVERTPFWRAISLSRTPGFKVYRPTL